MSSLTDASSVVDISFAIDGVGLLVTSNGSGLLVGSLTLGQY